mgnify:FL=1
MARIKHRKFFRFFSTTILTVALLLALASLPQACTVNVNNTANGGNVEDLEVSNDDNFINAETVKDLSTEVGDLIDQFRGKLLDWNNSNPTMSSALQKELTDIIDSAYKNSKELDNLDNQRARAAFYKSYWQDFQERVLNKTSQCRKASSLYGEAISLYKELYRESNKDISSEEAYILIELAHWLTNRDAGPLHYGGFDGYTEALNLLDIISSIPNLEKPIKYNVLVSQGVSRFELRKSYGPAATAFQSALDLYPESPSSDVLYNLGSMESYQANYEKAIELYKSSININDFNKLVPNIVNRDLGFAYILLEMFEDPSEQFSRYEMAIGYFDNIIQSSGSSLKPVAHIGKSLALYQMNQVAAAKSEILKSGDSDFAKYIKEMIELGEKNKPGIIDLVKQVSFGNIVPHDKEEEQVLDFFHGFFYCAEGDVRID